MDYLQTVFNFIGSTNSNDDNSLVLLELYKLICTFPPEKQHTVIYDLATSQNEVNDNGPGLRAKRDFTEAEEMSAIMTAGEKVLPYLCRIAEDAQANNVSDREIFKMVWHEIRRNRLLTSDLHRAMALTFFINCFLSDTKYKADLTAENTQQYDERSELVDESMFLDFHRMISSHREDPCDMLDKVRAKLAECTSPDEQRRCLFNLISACIHIGKNETADSESDN